MNSQLWTVFCSFIEIILILDGVNTEAEVHFHYTDEQGGEAIKTSGKILESTQAGGGGVLYGDGVYLTKWSPNAYSASEIARNNWGNSQFTQKTKRVYELRISSYVKKAKSDPRDIWIYPNGDLYLSDIDEWIYYDWSSGEVGDIKILASTSSSNSLTSNWILLSISIAYCINNH